jgi:deoxyribodipyrimidine photolyase-related protein
MASNPSVLVLLSNQLFHPREWPAPVRKVSKIYIIRVPEYENPCYHRQKLCLMGSALSEYKSLLSRKYKVVETKRCVSVQHYMFEIADMPQRKYVTTYTTVIPTPMFINPSDCPVPKRMYPFYVSQRKKLGLWIDGDAPLFGKWSFDALNRKKFPPLYSEQIKTYDSPSIRSAITAVNKIESAFGDLTHSYYPTTHAGAVCHLKSFIEERLRAFGHTQDSISASIVYGSHSNISALMNIGLLTPLQVLRELQKVNVDKRDMFIQVEAFVRQIIWREYMRLVYANSHNLNTLSGIVSRKRMPTSWYTATTGNVILDTTIQKFMKYGYCHHIERLMILNNALTMMEISIQHVYQWFMAVSVDSYDWVMVPNICMNHNAMRPDRRYMSRTYVSGSHYLNKMSDYPKAESTTFDTLFDAFAIRHSAILKKDYRLSGVIKSKLQKNEND